VEIELGRVSRMGVDVILVRVGYQRGVLLYEQAVIGASLKSPHTFEESLVLNFLLEEAVERI